MTKAKDVKVRPTFNFEGEKTAVRCIGHVLNGIPIPN